MVIQRMYYEGDLNNKITIGRDMGWGAIKSVTICGFIIGNGSALTALIIFNYKFTRFNSICNKYKC